MSSTPSATVTSLDHIVLTVKSIPASIAWYQTNLGMKHEQFSPASEPENPRHALLFGQSKINLHQAGHEFEPKATLSYPGTADLCFLTRDPIIEVRKRLEAANVEMVDLGKERHEEGTVLRTGARGKLRSVYCRDPDGNLIEISNYVESA